MTTQTTLFPDKLHIPQWLADYFHQANAGEYEYKSSFYTDIKPIVLGDYGVFSGYDLQIIEKKCRSCHGTGQYKHYHYENGRRYVLRTEPCYNCTDGIYYTAKVSLERYILNGKLYHMPCDAPVNAPVVSVIRGIVKHEWVAPQQAIRAYYILLWRYNKPLFYQRLKKLAETKIEGIHNLLQSLFRKDKSNDDLPF